MHINDTRSWNLFYVRHFADGGIRMITVRWSMAIRMLTEGYQLEDGRMIKSVDGKRDLVTLDDGSILSRDKAFETVVPILEGFEIRDGEAFRRIAAGPDLDGRVMFQDETTAILFGMKNNNPFPAQRDPEAHRKLLEEDRALRGQDGLVVPA